MMLTSRTYSGRQARDIHLANCCFASEAFETELATLRDAYAIDLFKNEGLAPVAAQRVARFTKRQHGRPEG